MHKKSCCSGHGKIEDETDKWRYDMLYIRYVYIVIVLCISILYVYITNEIQCEQCFRELEK